MGANQHVIPKHGQWAVQAEGNSFDTALFVSQADAIKLATRIAAVEQAQVVVHDADGNAPQKS